MKNILIYNSIKLKIINSIKVFYYRTILVPKLGYFFSKARYKKDSGKSL